MSFNNTVSIILATRNRSSILNQTLRAFEQLDLTSINLEIFVIDNGSTDNTQTVLEQWTDRLPLKFWSESRPGKNICLNQGVAKACGDLLIFTDDDVIPDPDWVTRYVAAAEAWPEHKIFGGKIDPLFSVEADSGIHALEPNFGVIFSKYHPAETSGEVNSPPFGPNMMIRRSVFDNVSYNESIGPAGNNYAMGSETELLVRLREEFGLKYLYVSEARVQHYIRPEQIELEWIWGRAYRAGRGFARAIQTERMRLAGVPWTILARYIVVRLKAKFLFFLSRSQVVKLQWELHKWRGCVTEYRKMHITTNSKTQ